MANNLDVKLRIDTAVEGLATIEQLVADLKSLLGIAGQKIPDPMTEVKSGADKADKSTDKLKKDLREVGKVKITDPTKPLQDGAAMAGGAVSGLAGNVKALGQAGEQAGRGVKAVGDQAKSAASGFNAMESAARTAKTVLAAYVSFQGLKSLTSTIIEFGAQYEQTMARVRAVTRATDSEFVALGNIAREMGKTTEFTARQAADGLAWLGLAGLNAQQAIAALPGTLNLAAAAQIDLGRAADITTNILTAMQLEISELGRVNDVLARTFTTSNTDIEMLGEAFKYAAPKAAAYGYEIEEIMGMLGQMANAGLRGSMAGTQLNFAFSKTSQVFAKFGESIFDAEGKVKNLIDAVELLAKQKASPGIINDIFGERGGRAVNALVGMERNNAGQLRKYINDQLRKAHEESAADVIAMIQRDTVQGAFKIMKSALEEVFVGSFQDMSASLIDVLQSLTEAITQAQPALIAFASTLIDMVKIGADILSFFLGLVNVFNDTSMRAIALKTAIAVLTIQGFRALLKVLVETGRTALAARAALLQNSAAQSANAAAATANAAAQGKLASGLTLVAAKAGAASTAARIFSGALSLVGGPIGLLVTAVVGLGAAWSEYNRKQEEAREKIRQGIPALKEKQEAVEELIKAWNDLTEAEAKAGGVENSKGRLAWLDEALKKAPHLSSEIKKLGTDFQAIGDLLKKNEQDVFSDRVKNYADNIRVAQETINNLEAKISNFSDAQFNRRAFGLEGWADKLTPSIEQFKTDIDKQKELITAVVSDAARAYAERAVKEGVDLNEAINKGTIEFMKQINLSGAAGVVGPEKLAEEIRGYLSQFYEQATKAAADKISKDLPQLDENFRVQLSNTEKMIQDFGGKLSGLQLLDLSKSISGHQQAKEEFLNFMGGLEGSALSAVKSIKEQMKNLTPGTEQYKLAEKDQKDYQDAIEHNSRQTLFTLTAMDAEYLAQKDLEWEELKRGEKITGQDRVDTYIKFAEMRWKVEAEETANFIRNKIKEKEEVIDACNVAIEHLNAVGATSTLVGQSILMVLKGAQLSASIQADAANVELTAWLAEEEARRKEFLNRMQTSLKGIGRGTGKSPAVRDAERESKALEAETKRRAEYERKIQEESLRAALQRGEIDIKEFMAKKAAMAQESADNEVAIAKAALDKIKADRNASQADIMKAETDLMMAENNAPKQYQEAYKESFDIIAQEHAALQSKLQQQVDYTNTQIEAGFLSQAQGQRQIKEQVEQTLPILESMVAQYEAMVAECERLGIVIPGVTDKLLEMKGVNLQNKQVMNQTANEINAVFENALSSALSNVADQWHDLIGLARTFIKTILDGIAQIAAKNIASSLFTGLGMGGSGGGIGGWLTKLLPGFAGGGPVRGPGTSTSDSIPAWLSRDEFVLNARSVRILARYWGRRFLYGLNNVKNPGDLMDPNIARFATGGPVSPTTAGFNGATPAGGLAALTSNIGLTVHNTFDEDGFVTRITRNPKFRQGLLRTAGEEKKAFRNIIS